MAEEEEGASSPLSGHTWVSNDAPVSRCSKHDKDAMGVECVETLSCHFRGSRYREFHTAKIALSDENCGGSLVGLLSHTYYSYLKKVRF